MGFLDTAKTMQKISDPFFEDMWGLNNKMPDYKLAELDPEVQKLKDRMMARAEMSTGDIAGEKLQGTDQSGLLRAAQEQREAGGRSLGANDEMAALDKMISSRAQKKYEQSLGDLKRKVNLNAPVERFQRMAGGEELNRKVAEMESQLVDREVQNTLNRRAARNATIGNVLGIAGAVVGGIFGGPAGAQAGMQVGGSMGGPKSQYTMGELNKSRGGR